MTSGNLLNRKRLEKLEVFCSSCGVPIRKAIRKLDGLCSGPRDSSNHCWPICHKWLKANHPRIVFHMVPRTQMHVESNRVAVDVWLSAGCPK